MHRYHRNEKEPMPLANLSEPSLSAAVADFLADLTHANRSAHKRRAYATELRKFETFYAGSVAGITAEVLRAFLATGSHLQPAS